MSTPPPSAFRAAAYLSSLYVMSEREVWGRMNEHRRPLHLLTRVGSRPIYL